MMSPRLKAGFISAMAMTMVMMTLVLVGQKTLIPEGSFLASLPSSPAGAVVPGDGLIGTYYKNTSFTNPVLIRKDTEVNFNFGGGSPAPEVPSDFFSIRWTGQIRAEQTGTYTFYTTNDDGAVLKIDNEIIINDPNEHPPTENRGVIDFEAGQRYDINLDYFESIDIAVIKLEYEGPQTPRQVIPTRVLYSESTECSDKVDNDGDGKLDFPVDPGCDSSSDDSEQDAKCSDNLDNDGDGKIDFPVDPGCDSSSDEDETDPAAVITINLGSGNNNVDESDNNYPLGIEANRQNEIFVKSRVGNRFEMVRMTPTLLPSFNTQPGNASIHYYLLQGTDSEGGGHLSVIQGRYWDAAVFADDTLTPSPWHEYFQAGTDLSSCAQEMGDRFSAVPFYLDNAFFFQQMIEMLTLCQR